MQKRGGKQTKAQVSMEYLAIFSISMLMIIPLILIFATQTQNIQTDISNAQIERAASEIIDAVEEVHFMGEPAKKTIRIKFPGEIEKILINGTEITFEVLNTDLAYNYTVQSTTNMTGTLQTFEGDHMIVVEAQANSVSISEK